MRLLSRLHRAITSPELAVAVGEPAFRLFGYRPSSRRDSLEEARRLLVVRLDRIGDMVLFSPFLRELRRCVPKARITLVASPETAELAARCPRVDEVLVFDRGGRTRLWRLLRHWRSLGMASRGLWRRRFDLALCPRFGSDIYHDAFLAYASGAPRRIGWSERGRPEEEGLYPGRDRLLTVAFVETAPMHETLRNLDFLRRLGGGAEDCALEPWDGPADAERARAALREAGLGDEERYAVLAPGAGVPKRVWPAERFAAIGDRLAARHGLRIVLVGGPGEESLAERVSAAMRERPAVVAGRLTVPECGAAMRRAVLFLGNDSGPAHLAAAAGAPVVMVSCHPEGGDPMHANSPERFGPIGARCVAVRPPRPRPPCVSGCGAGVAHCVLEVDTEVVSDAAERLLSGKEEDS